MIHKAIKIKLMNPYLQGVEHLKEVLPNVIRYESIPDFNHGDFTYANNSRKILYQKILRSFEAINETRV